MDYQLLPHEYMIMNSDRVSFGKNSMYTDELILTNLHLIYIKKGIFGGKKLKLLFQLTKLRFLRENRKFQLRNLIVRND